MNSIGKILRLIDNEDAIPILAEDSLVETFNEMLRLELIEIVEDRVVLTSRGKEARIHGIDKIVNDLKIQNELMVFSDEGSRKELIFCVWIICLSLLMVLIYVLAIEDLLFGLTE